MFAAPALADDAASRDEPPPDRPSSLAEIKEATDIAPGSPEFELLPPAAQALLLEHPDVEAAVVDGRVAAFYGGPLATASTPEEAERAFWSTYRDAFGVADLDVAVTRSHDVGRGRFTVYAYQQRIRGLPVEYATGRLLIRNGSRDADSLVPAATTFVSGRFADADLRLPDFLLSPLDAVGVVAGSRDFGYMRDWSEPELVVYAGRPDEWVPAGFGPPVAAWKFTGEFMQESKPPQLATFFVAAETGELLGVRSEVRSFTDVAGSINGYATPIVRNGQPWAGPYSESDPDSIAQLPIPEMRAFIDSQTGAYSLSDGTFAIPYGGSGAVDVQTGVAYGHLARVINSGGPPDGFDPIGVAVADLDRDNLNDVVLLCKALPGTSDACVVVAWGASSSSTSYSFASGATVVSLLAGGVPARLAVGDVGGSASGRDIVVTLSNQNGMQILYYDGSRSFTASGLVTAETDEQPPQTVLEPQYVAVGDWDADGLGDIAVAGYRPIGIRDRPVLALLWGESGGTFDKRAYHPTFDPNDPDEFGKGRALSEWIGSNGNPAFAITNSETNAPTQKFYVFRRVSGGSRDFDSAEGYSGFSSNTLAALRVDTDTLFDFASCQSAMRNPIRWYRQLSSGDFDLVQNEIFPTEVGVASLAAGRLTKNATLPLTLDDRYDLARVWTPITPNGTDELYVRLMPNNTGLPSGSRFSTYDLIASANPFDVPYPSGVVIADINVDGFPDLVVSNRGLLNNSGNPPVDLHEGFSVILSRGAP